MSQRQSNKGRGRWQPMQRGQRLVPEAVRQLAASDEAVANHLARSSEEWRNDRYAVIVYRRADDSVACLSVRRIDQGAVRDWRHMQRIKTEIAGPAIEAFQLFPAEKRLVDLANQTWLWCLPPGVEIPVGFTERAVAGPAEAAAIGATQREFEPGILDAS